MLRILFAVFVIFLAMSMMMFSSLLFVIVL